MGSCLGNDLAFVDGEIRVVAKVIVKIGNRGDIGCVFTNWQEIEMIWPVFAGLRRHWQVFWLMRESTWFLFIETGLS